MNTNEALALIGTNDESEWEEILVQRVFEIKQFILKAYHPPQVCWARATKLNQMATAQQYLINSENVATSIQTVDKLDCTFNTLNIADLIAAYREFEKKQSALKLAFLQAQAPLLVALYLTELGDIEQYRLTELAKLANQLNVAPYDLKLSTFINTGEIIKELERFKSDTLTDTLVNNLPILSTELVKSLNYINFTKK